MAFPLTPAQIATAIAAPLSGVATSWPALESALVKHGIYSEGCAIAVIATVRVECPSFLPQHEKYDGDPTEYFTKHYDISGSDPAEAKRLGNTQVGDGVRYAGRGFIQLTGRANYVHYGLRVHVPLVAQPERALEPEIAAEILALYFADRCMPEIHAEAWTLVRRQVNGGTNGLALFMQCVHRLQDALATYYAANAPGLTLPVPEGLQ